MSPLHIVILAAGQGKRMKSDLPKVMHRLAGRTLLEHVVDASQELQPVLTHVVYGHGGEQVRDAHSALPVQWVRQNQQLGTGHAVEQAMPAIPDDASVLVLYADVPLLNPKTLKSVVGRASHGELALISVEVADPAGYGRIVRRADGAVSGIVEEKDADTAQLEIREINTGILAVDAEALRRWLARLDDNNAQGERYLTDIIAQAVAEDVAVQTIVPECVEEVLGVNDRAQLAHLERHYQRRLAEQLMLAGVTVSDPARLDIRGDVRVGRDVILDVNVILEGRVVLGDRVVIGPNASIKNVEIGSGSEVLANCVVEDARIGSGCRIGPFARLRPGTRLDDEVHVGNFVEVKNTRVGRGSKANHLTYLGDSEIGQGVNVGAGTITCNYDGANKHTTVIEDDVFIGSGVELVAPVTVRAGATVGAGSTVTKDVPPGALTVSRTRQSTVDRWSRPRKTKQR